MPSPNPLSSFTRSDTYLALDTVLTGAQATANGKTGAVDAVALGALGRVDWLTTASASGTSAPSHSRWFLDRVFLYQF